MEYKKELHPLLETLGLIYLTKNFSSSREKMIHSLEEMETDGEAFYKKNLSYLERYVSEFQKKYIPDPEDDFFFGNSLEFFLIVTALLTEYPELETDIDTLTEEEVLRRFECFFTEGTHEGLEGHAPENYILEKQSPKEKVQDHHIPEKHISDTLDTLEKRFALIQSTEYPEEAKWKLLTLLNHPLEKCRALIRIYRRNRPAFEYTLKMNQDCMGRLLAEAPAETSAVMKNLIGEFAPDGITVYQTAVFPLMEWLISKIAFQGIITDKLYLHQKNLSDAREILPGMLKILGDKSKFEILCSLKERGKYNLEIAEELRLTPATASHHMGILLSNQFVTVEKKNGKVYYRLNEETVAEMIRCLEGVFLN